MSKDDKGVTRRDLFTFWRREKPRAPVEIFPLRPPGMMYETLLLHTCQRCGKCVEACPADAIFPLGPEWGAKQGTPAVDARKQPCVLCEGLLCTHACPTGALQPAYANRDVKMGTAVLDVARCLPWRGQPCDACEKACPVPGAIVPRSDGKIAVEEELCTGCGLCEHVCPTEPASIRVVPRQ